MSALPRQFFQVDGLGLEKARATIREAINAGLHGANVPVSDGAKARRSDVGSDAWFDGLSQIYEN